MARRGDVNDRATDDRAEKIVDYVLHYVEWAGRFEGRGKDRKLRLQDMITLEASTRLPVGEPRNSRDVMIEGVRKFLARARAKRAPKRAARVGART